MVDLQIASDKEVCGLRLYEPLPFVFRLDVLPWGFLYASLVLLSHQLSSTTTLPDVSINGTTTVCFCLLVVAHLFMVLLCEWSTEFKCWCRYVEPKQLELHNTALVVKVTPFSKTAPQQICALETIKDEKNQKVELSFVYQKVHFLSEGSNVTDEETSIQFQRLKYPINSELKSYTNWTGYTTQDEIIHGHSRWGINEFDIPLAPFFDLLKEHLIAPFFVFQFFCMLLWCLDEYVYYSLLTLVMLVVFECTVVKQRQRNMIFLRQMRREPIPILVYRQHKWSVLSNHMLLPKDIVSIKSDSGFTEGHDNNEELVPADLLLLRGSCVVNEAMISGESIPLRKEALEFDIENEKLPLQIEDGTSQIHKKHIIFAGTKVLQHSITNTSTTTSSDVASKNSNVQNKMSKIPRPPDGGCPAYVLQTGFGTTQGGLMRRILYASERVSANNGEAFMFIAFLLAFALCAAGYVLHTGLLDASRNRFKLLLHCIMIITSVVPPELPMQLSLAVNNSLIALSKFNVFCTEPFRIPFAGKVTHIQFDKTGTLTSDELVMHGVVVSSNEAENTESEEVGNGSKMISEVSELSMDIQVVLASCHSLILLHQSQSKEKKVVIAGDPLEKTCLEEIQWQMTANDTVVPPSLDEEESVETTKKIQRNSPQLTIRIIHRYSFNSDLKRMSALICMEEPDFTGGGRRAKPLKRNRLVMKGAPEIMQPLFRDIPSNYEEMYQFYTLKGCRVLALGFRDDFDDIGDDQLRDKNQLGRIPRSQMEKNLIFAGFLILDCPLKKDSKKIVKELLASSHEVSMITGDNPYTACDVAKQVAICRKPRAKTLFLQVKKETTELHWAKMMDTAKDESSFLIPFDIANLEELARQYDLCVTGAALKIICTGSTVSNVSKNDGYQKEKEEKQLMRVVPFVKVFARTSPQQKEHILSALNKCGCVTVMCGDGTNDVGALKQAHVGISIINNPELEMAKKKKKLQNPEQAVVVKLGDASIASPFTSKSPSIKVAANIIKQGRCTLVTTIQMFKILGINCLLTAYSLSVLFVHGVKQGDTQMTVFGVLVAFFFLFLSWAKPTRKLSGVRPPASIFNPWVVLSLILQFSLHLSCLIYVMQFLVLPIVNRNSRISDNNQVILDASRHPDAPFSPNLLNTTMFYLSFAMQLNTFVTNYMGHPFMEKMTQNKLFIRSAVFSYILLIFMVFELFSPINALLELTPMPSQQLSIDIFSIIALDTVSVLAVEWVITRIAFANNNTSAEEISRKRKKKKNV